MSLGTHSEFRIKLLKKGLSMQEVLEECAVRIAQQDRYMDKMLDELVERKITGERKIAESDAQSLYRLIEAEDDESEQPHNYSMFTLAEIYDGSKKRRF